MAAWVPPTSARNPAWRACFQNDRVYYRIQDTPVHVEADLGNKADSRKCAEAFASALARRGATFGPNGLVLRVTHRVELRDSGLEGAPEPVLLPILTVTASYVDVAGRTLWTTNETLAFHDVRWDFMIGERDVNFDPKQPGRGPVRVESFKFNGDPQRLTLAALQSLSAKRATDLANPILGGFWPEGSHVTSTEGNLKLPLNGW